MEKRKHKGLFLFGFGILTLLATAVRSAQVLTDAHAAPMLQVLKQCFIPLLLTFLTATVLWCAVGLRGYYKKSDIYIWNRTAKPEGILAFAAAIAMAFLLVSEFIPALLQRQGLYEIAAAAATLLTVVFFSMVGITHRQGGWTESKTIGLISSLGPLLFFLARLIFIFVTLVAIYPTPQHILDQMKETALLLYFLGYAKMIWFSGHREGNKMLLIMSFIGVLFIAVAVLPALLSTIAAGVVPSLTLLSESIFYLLLGVYMTATGIRSLSEQKPAQLET